MPPKTDPTAPHSRVRLRLDADWRFHLGDLPESPFQVPVRGWRTKHAGTKAPLGHQMASPGLSTTAWKPIRPWRDGFDKKPGFAWFRTVLPDAPGPSRVLHFVSVSDVGTVFLNEKELARHEVWTDPFDVVLDPAWREGGPNHLAVLVQNHWGTGFIGDANMELPVPASSSTGPASFGYDDLGWRKVHLPHDFVVEGSFDEKTNDPAHGYLPKGIGWYRKTFDLSEGDRSKSLWIDFDGVFRNCRVWLNGRYLGRHRSGYTGFRFDLKDAAIFGGANVLAVRVDARGHEGWWYEGGGIYRHVWLNKADPVHVSPWGVFLVAVPTAGKALVKVETSLENLTGKKVSIRLVSEVLDARGRTVLRLPAKTVQLLPGKKSVVQKGPLPRPRLWSLEDPHLYRCVTKVTRNGGTLDRVETPFGVRSIRFDADRGFLLNGKTVKLKGTCNHQDHAGVGVALPDRLFTYRLERLKAMGSNAYRCSHNPPAPELLDECDRLGMLVIDENRRLGSSPEVLSQLESMVLRDRNHPSVILWSLCNEEGKQGTEEGRLIGLAMKRKVLSLDRTRPVTAAMNGGWGAGLTKVIDVHGFNYNIVQYDPFRAGHPRMPVYGSETASTVSTRGVYETDRAKGTVSAYDVNHTEWSHSAENAWRPVAVRPHMAGVFVWTGFDYKGEPTPYGWPCVNSHFGILDLCGFPKDNFHYYRAWWGPEPVLHLFPHWNWPGKNGEQVDVWCHTNYDQVELFLNGKSLGWKETPPYGHLEWKVWYEPGVLTAKAYKKGVFAAETRVETVGKPAALRLTPYAVRLKADGEDLTPVTVEVLDQKGRLVPVADDLVRFELAGPGHIAGVGNGNPSSHEPDKADRRKAFNGLCMVLVQTEDGTPGRIRLTARAKGLKPARVILDSK